MNQRSAGQALSKPASDLEVAGEIWRQWRSWPFSLGMVLGASGYHVAEA